MKINRRYKRSIKNNLSFYLSSTILTVVALMMYLVFSIGGRGIQTFVNDFFESQKVEDAEFLTYLPIEEKDITQIENDFNLVLERQEYLEFEEKDYTARVFSRNEKINLYDITKGKDATSSDEIIISQGYAENMSVEIGDTVSINGKNYKVTGYFERPDYLYMIQNTTDSAKNVTSFFLAYVSDEEFESLENPACNYVVRYEEDNSLEFRKYINDKYKIVTYMNSDENSRISEIITQPALFISMSYFMLILVPCVVVALISTIIGRMVKREQKQIGTLMALGYRKGTLTKHYAGFAIIPGLVGSVLAIIIVSLTAQSMGSLCLSDYEPINAKFHVQIFEMVLCIVIPTTMYLLTSFHSVRKLLKKKVVLLLSGNSDGGKKKAKMVLANSKMHFGKKFAIRSIWLNKSRSFVVFLGIFLGGFIIMFALSFVDSLKAIVDVGGTDIGSFEYEYVMNYMMTDEPKDAEPVIVTTCESENGSSFYIMGMNEDNKYIKIDDESGDRLSLGTNDCIMTSLAAKIYGVKVGDEFEFRDSNTLKEHKVKITSISKNSFQKCIYLTMENAREVLGWEDGWYNTLLSDKKLDIDESNVSFTVTKESVKEQMDTIIDQMGLIVYTLVFLGIIICISAIYVTVNMLVDDNKVNISMLKVLGYHKKEINRMILNVNTILLVLGLVISIPFAFWVSRMYFESMADSLGCILPMVYNPVSIITAIVVVVACYYCSLWRLKKKVYRVNAVESMKDHRD